MWHGRPALPRTARSHRPTTRHLGLAAVLAAVACGGAEAPPWAGEILPDATALGPRIAPLAYRAPDPACPWAYEIAIDYDVAPMAEEPSVSGALLARRPAKGYAGRTDGPIPPGRTVEGRLFYQGVRVAKRGARRTVYFGRKAPGPAAPTAPCTARTWDPLEDFLALAFPELPGRPTTTGETWNGARVEGRCNKTACIDPETYAGGRENHLRPCVTEDVQETLAAVLDTDAGPVAAIEGRWSDGHGDRGISMERVALVSLAAGRPLYARTTIHHRFPQPTYDRRFGPITRTVTIRAVDRCEGVPDAPAFADRDGLREALADADRDFDAEP